VYIYLLAIVIRRMHNLPAVHDCSPCLLEVDGILARVSGFKKKKITYNFKQKSRT